MQTAPRCIPTVLRPTLLIFLLCMATRGALAQTFTVEFRRWADPPLVKTRFGVYQTPLARLPRLLRSCRLLREVGVQDLRYEVGWGKPDALACSQVYGTAAQLRYDFVPIDALVAELKGNGVRPLLAIGYCPDPLKRRAEWSAWKDMPSDLEAWEEVVRQYAGHLRGSAGPSAPLYEVWNEPDLPPQVFFTGTPDDYGALYAGAARGIREGDGDALVGGPAAAWDLRFLNAMRGSPMDFASIHAYGNFPVQLGMIRDALRDRPDLPILLTEYASYASFPPDGPHSRHQAAALFFRDVQGMLRYPDLAKVYWAQWLDAGDGPGMGLVTWDGHRKAIFNALKLYSMMPVDRCAVIPDGSNGIGVMASADDRSAAVVIWNEQQADRTVTLRLRDLPFRAGKEELYRIDAQHASYVDNPTSEMLEPTETQLFRRAGVLSRTLSIPGESVVFLRLLPSRPLPAPVLPSPGTYVRTHYWFADRASPAYADFDPRTWTARLGMGDRETGTALIAVVMDDPAPTLVLRVKRDGPFARIDRHSLFGVRIDFRSHDGRYGQSALVHGGLYDPLGDASLPWGTRAAPSRVLHLAGLSTGRPVTLSLKRVAPADWDGTRVIISFILRDAGRNSRARIELTRAPGRGVPTSLFNQAVRQRQ